MGRKRCGVQRRIADLNRTRRPIGKKVDRGDSGAAIQGPGHLIDGILVRIEDDDLDIPGNAVGQGLPIRDAGINEQKFRRRWILRHRGCGVNTMVGGRCGNLPLPVKPGSVRAFSMRGVHVQTIRVSGWASRVNRMMRCMRNRLDRRRDARVE